MSRIRNTFGLLALVGVAAILVGGFWVLQNPAIQTIQEMLKENKVLQTALNNLKAEDTMGMAKLVGQSVDSNGVTVTTLKFATASGNEAEPFSAAEELTVSGKEVYFDAMVVQFDPKLVESGEKKAMYFWRRIYGDEQKPNPGVDVREFGEVPARYAEIFGELTLREQQTFWDALWDLENNPDKLAEMGISAVVGKAVYKKIDEGKLYHISLQTDGGMDITVEKDF